MNELNQTPYSLYKSYAEELVDYQDKFLKEFGFFPYQLDGVFFQQGLTHAQQKLCFAYWNQPEVVRAQTLMELFFDVCDEIEAKRLD
jgi:hypothetical protein